MVVYIVCYVYVVCINKKIFLLNYFVCFFLKENLFWRYRIMLMNVLVKFVLCVGIVKVNCFFYIILLYLLIWWKVLLCIVLIEVYELIFVINFSKY